MTGLKSAPLRLGPTRTGFCLQVVGRGTMRESVAVHACVVEGLENSDGTFTVDLSQCLYLDSTFLGSLIGLHKQFNVSGEARFFVAASPAKTQQLLAPMQLHQLLEIVPCADELVGAFEDLPTDELETETLGMHSMHCHRQLAELDGPQREIFMHIADQLNRELSERGRRHVAQS